jgi:hypothetical protein
MQPLQMILLVQFLHIIFEVEDLIMQGVNASELNILFKILAHSLEDVWFVFETMHLMQYFYTNTKSYVYK